MDDYDKYIKDLERALAQDYDYVYLSHSLSMDAGDVKLNARMKISQYLDYRRKRKHMIHSIIKVSHLDLSERIMDLFQKLNCSKKYIQGKNSQTH